MSAIVPIRLGRPSIREDPAEQGMVLADFPLTPAADARWMSIFAARIGASPANAWTVTGESIRLRTTASADALRADLATLQDVVGRTNSDVGERPDSPASADAMASLRKVLDDEFGPA